MFCTSAAATPVVGVVQTPVITVNEGVSTRADSATSLHELQDDADEGDASGEDGGVEEVRDIGQSKLADLARRSMRFRRRVHLRLHRQRCRQQLQLEEAKQIERLRRDKDILANFMRLRLYETQSSFSSSDMASSSGVERGSDTEKRPGSTTPVTGESDRVDAPGDDSRRDAGSVSGMSASTRAGGAGGGTGGAGGAGGGARPESSARSRRREDIRKILWQRRQRHRLMLLSCGEGGAEQYTDKTRNAAVVMGEKDIKLSLKQQRRALAAARGFSLPACAQPSGLTAMARAQRRAGQPRAALLLTEQALLLDPVSKAALLERSQCYQQLGQPRLALLDAEDALDLDKTNDAAFLHKASALYSMGHFEKALVMYHRGSRLRPENPAFHAGIRRSTDAIMNIIGCLRKDFALSSCEKLLQNNYWPDEESSVGSARRVADLGALGLPPGTVRALRLGANVAVDENHPGRPGSNVLLWDDRWAGEDDADVPEKTIDLQGLCESCNTAHEYVDVKERPRRSTLNVPLEEEARQIALILSVTNAHDSRNKHLREKLMFIPPTPPPPSTAAHATSHRPPPPRPPGHGDDGRPARPSRDVGGDGERVDTVCRPGVDRLPPSLGRDATFLQRLARDPGLQGLAVSGLAEEAVRYLRGRQVFWQRRGPLIPGRAGRAGRARPRKGSKLSEAKPK